MRLAQRLGGNEIAIAKARVGGAEQGRQRQGAARRGAGRGARTTPATSSRRVQWLRRDEQGGRAGRLILTVPQIRQRSSTSTNGGSSAGCSRASCSTTATPDRLSRRARRRAAEQGELPRRAAVHRRLDRAALPERSGNRRGHISRGSAQTPEPDRARARRLLAGPRRGSAGPERARRASTMRRRRSTPTAYYGQIARARLGLRRLCGLRRPPVSTQPEHAALSNLKSCAPRRFSTRSTPATSLASIYADLGESANDIAGTGGDRRSRRAERRRPRHAADRQGGAGARPAARHYAFPTVGLPRLQPIGPAVETAVVYSIARQESTFNPTVVSSANAMGLMQVTPAAGKILAKKFKVHVRREAPAERPGLQRADGRRRARRPA